MSGAQFNNGIRLSVFEYVENAVNGSAACESQSQYRQFQQERCLVNQNNGYPTSPFCGVTYVSNNVEYLCDETLDSCDSAAEVDVADEWPYFTTQLHFGDVFANNITEPCFEVTKWTFSTPGWGLPYCSSSSIVGPSVLFFFTFLLAALFA